jgi:dolichol-phosphate mannosyltransferase
VPWTSLVLALGLLALPRRRRPADRRPGPLPAEPRVLVVLPTYDERETIEAVLDGLLAIPWAIHALVVDDASPDGTGDIVRGRAGADERVSIVSRPTKAGLASAYAIGFRRGLDAGYDLVVEMDSDLSHRPDELPRLLETAGTHDVVIGSRYVPGGSVSNWSRLRVALSRAGNRYARFCLGLDVRDATSGFRVYRADALRAITAAPIRSDGYGFQIELASRAWNAGLAIGEIPITFRERSHGQSKISRRIVIEALWLVTLWGVRARLGPRATG